MGSKAIDLSLSSAPKDIFTPEDINVSLRFEIGKLKRKLAKAHERNQDIMERIFYLEADRDHYRKQAQERKL